MRQFTGSFGSVGIFIVVVLVAIGVVSCTSTVAPEQPSSGEEHVMPEEARVLSDSAFHMHYTRNDSTSLKGALDLYYQSLEIDPDNFITLTNIWQLENRLSLYPAALETSRKMLRVSDNDVTCIGMTGIALDHVGDSVQARKYYQWSLDASDSILDTMETTNPRWSTVALNRGTMLTMLGRTSEADEAFDYFMANADSNMAEAALKFKGKTRSDYLVMKEPVE